MIQTRLHVHLPGERFPVVQEVTLSAAEWLNLGAQALSTLPQETAGRQEYYALGGCDGASSYTETLQQLDALIGRLKQVRAEVQALREHTWAWTEDQYCLICGADGAA